MNPFDRYPSHRRRPVMRPAENVSAAFALGFFLGVMLASGFWCLLTWNQ